MKVSSKIKRTVAAMIAIAGLAMISLPSTASALSIPNGDFGFYVYGGTTERYQNLGTGSTSQVGVSPITSNVDLASLQTGATLGLRYSLIGVDTAGANMYFSTVSSTVTPLQIEQSSPDVAAGNFLQWAQFSLPQDTGGPGLVNNPALVLKSSGNAFTQPGQLGSQGNLNGTLDFVMHGTPGQLLNIFKVNIDGNPGIYQFVTTATLSANGALQVGSVAPVPVPAVVYLFGTGLVALVGIARRSMNKNKMAA